MNYNKDVFEILPELKDNSISLVFSDPPYNMGSKYRINPETGKPQEVKLSEFMGNKWEGLTCEQIEIFFKECFRVCKYGAYVVLYGIDRVQMPFEYFAQLAGFEPQQYLYSYKISSFPKALNIQKALDKKENTQNFSKKYDGYSASISPYKQVLETIMVFRKEYPKGINNVEAVYEYEKGNKEIHPSLINIEGGRVECVNEKDLESTIPFGIRKNSVDRIGYNKYKSDIELGFDKNNPSTPNSGRYPSQLFIIDDERLKEEIGYNTSDILDEQSGNLISGSNCIRTKSSDGYHGNIGKSGDVQITYGDSGGCSRINHKCHYTEEENILQDCLYSNEEFDILTYCTKVSGKERNAGCEKLEGKERFGQGNYSQSPICKTCNKTINGTNDHTKCSGEIYYDVKEENSVQKNNHPTLKNLELDKRISSLFAPPKENLKDFVVFNPFSGTRSERIGLMSNGVLEENIISCELNSDYFLIGEKREKYWKEHNFKFMKEERKELKKVKKENKTKCENEEGWF